MTDLTDAFAAVIRGDCGAAAALSKADPRVVRRMADAHGVLPLLAHHLAHVDDAPPALRSSLVDEARRRAAADLLQTEELKRCLAALNDGGVPVLLMKGAQLAFSHYERPDLRPRVDTDVLVSTEMRPRLAALLARGGYVAVGQLPGNLVMYQEAYTKRLNGALVHVLDVHWRTANPQAFGDVLPYDQAASSAVDVAGLGPGARGLCATQALLLACVHRVAHHFDSQSLLWLYDIHLVASRLDQAEWTDFRRLAREQGVATVCAEGLQRAARYFHTGIPENVSAKLIEDAQRGSETATAAYLTPRRRHVENIISDLRALPTWSIRWRLVRQHLVPPAQYMRAVYAPSSDASLPMLYVKRAIRGARRWLSRP